MEEAFIKLYQSHNLLALEIGHNSVADWNIEVYDRRNKEPGNWGDPILHVQGCDKNLVFAEAFVKLAEYFNEKLGGY